MKITPVISKDLQAKNASQIADFIFNEQALLARNTGRDSTLVLSELMIQYGLYWVSITFNNFEKSRAYLNSFFSNSGLPQDIIIGGLSATNDGAFMILGGDFRNYEKLWLELLDGMNRNKNLTGIVQTQFITY